MNEVAEDITGSEKMGRYLRKAVYVIGGLAFAYMMLGIFAFLVQRETWPIALMKLVTGMSLACAAFRVIFPYVWKPEEFFIKRFRPKGKTTNMQLLARAFGGSGVTAAAWALGSGLIWGLRLDAWLTVTLFGAIAGGTVIYIILRFFTYRKLPPHDAGDMLGGTGAVFVRRSPG